MTIIERAWVADQSVHYEHVFTTVNETRLRTRIRRNAYDNQSWGVVDRWSGEQWHEVIRWDAADFDAEVLAQSYTRKERVSTDAFSGNAFRFEEIARDIIGVI